MSDFRWRVVPPCVLTLVAMLAGVAAIVQALQGNLQNAATLIFASMLLDGVDGAVARLLRGTSKFGMELDSFSDAIALGAAPAVLVFQLTRELVAGSEQLPQWLPKAGAVLCAMVVCAGVVRLARFRLTNDPHKDKGAYQGLAIGGPAGWVALFTFCHAVGATLPGTAIPFGVSEGPLAILFWVVLPVLPFLEVSSIPYPKPTKNLYKFGLFALCLVAMLTVEFHPVRDVAALLILVYGLWYVLGAPILHRRQQRRPRLAPQ